ncbi:TerB family tellurite resistance protein [Shewanella intestini]|uniref:TerB family tellurite resistance protein n=1 Tax=Shewanella intestini TaxID=2017544 RepID=A0ABS5I5Y7_9GAMM|nr:MULTISPECIES: TerB family tellurite resistance protein [Shewanella]MBR9728735.1 TerB family tellurite resistance protein [Shewanella intestini]MRG36811.1 TerB family tellurite resistance protein [Shewanella sp. XMDDZSB0408]
MIAKLKQLFLSPEVPLTAQQKTQQLNLAAAALLLEVVYADDHVESSETALLPAALTQTLHITLDDATALLEQAKQARFNATSLFEFTEKINAAFSVADKQQLILAMWQLAYADGELCRYEDQIIRRTADLLYLKHSELIHMRNIAMEKDA